MAVETGRPYLSIGETLNVLQEEFPDVTVSKIRFLESEDLIRPERTASGYRKFSDADIERLRYILRLQRDQFLPLKVIKERLDDMDAKGVGPGGQSTLAFDEPVEDAPAVAPSPARPEPAQPADEVFRTISTGVSLSFEELVKASGLDEKQVRELETYGVVRPRQVDDEQRYDEVALEAAKLSKDLLDLGLEPRHLRVFRSAADRWSALAEQMVMPLVKQRNPEARRAAADTVRELVRVGNKLLQTMLRDAIAPLS